jgi:arginyl-tRNA synthetase
MNLFEAYRNHILATARAIAPEAKLDAITLEPPRDAAHGDLSTNAAMVLAGQLKAKPRDIAEQIAAELRTISGVEAVEIAGPGFIQRLAGNYSRHPARGDQLRQYAHRRG